jgi:D-beta-D-heptose 7-phosphate kinase/D-beta-D-heptose 1-phosphate adenosyltransferase
MNETFQELRDAFACARGARVLVIGDLMLDEYIWGNVDRISPEAPVQVLDWLSAHDGLGGAANVAQNLVALGCEVLLVGVVGEDAKGDKLRQHLAERGIKTEYVITDPSRPTTSKLRVMAHAQQILRIDQESREALSQRLQETLAKHINACIPWVDGIICSDYGKGVLTSAILAGAQLSAYSNAKLIIADPKGSDYSRYRHFDVVTPNQKELEGASQMQTRTDSQIGAAGAKILKATEVGALLVTRGKDGMMLLRREGSPVVIPATAREVYDVTGAGDTVISVFGMALFKSVDIELAARLANFAAGIKVGKLGAAPVTRDEIVTQLEAGAPLATSKILSLHDLVSVVSRARGQGKQIVFTNGCFDLLHMGHVNLLQQARGLGDFLIVGLNDDASVNALKGQGRPLIGQNERAHVLAALDAVDFVTFFSEKTPDSLIEAIRPDVLVKGSDYKVPDVVGRSFVEGYGGRVELIPITQGYSTTALVRRIERHRQSESSSV